MNFSSTISRLSAAVLFLGGACLLFAPDAVLPFFALATPRSATWTGQLVGAGWLAVAGLNWLSRGSVLGGIYGRPIVTANVALYFISAMVLVRAGLDGDARPFTWIVAGLHIVLAGIYGWLLFRGPVDRLKHNG